MFIPIGDDNPTERRPYVTYALIAANIIVFLLMTFASEDANLIRWTMIPAHWEWPTLFTSMFMHAGWPHLLGNMLFLWIFGDNVEDRLGRVGYVIFYLFSGLVADAAHIASNPESEIPTLGASGAVSGVMGAYIVFFPRHHVRTFIWLWVFVDVVRTPAFLWIGIWILQQVLLNVMTPQGSGGVAYLAHIGGFAAGAAIGGILRVAANYWPSSGRRRDALDEKDSGRRIFNPIEEEPGIDWMDEPGDGYSVLRLSEDPRDVSRISEATAPITGESPFDVVDRLVITRGVIARAIPREDAARIQRELHVLGIPSAVILHNRSNFPPRPAVVEGVSWDDRAIRLRAGDQVLLVPWTTPILFAGARIDGRGFIDVFVTRRTAYRIPDSRGIPLRAVDPDGRTETPTDLAGFARAVLKRAPGGAISEGVREAAEGSDGGRLDFRSAAHYDDYIFWLYNLTLAQGSRA